MWELRGMPSKSEFSLLRVIGSVVLLYPVVPAYRLTLANGLMLDLAPKNNRSLGMPSGEQI